jgi:hypothetical protein
MIYPMKMKNVCLSLSFFLVSLLTAPITLGQSLAQNQKLFDEAYFEWEDGKYISSIQKMIRILESENADGFLEKIALRTGEWHKVTELSDDGSNLRFSAEGQLALWDRISDGEEFAHYYHLETGKGGKLKGRNLVISPDGKKAWLIRTGISPELQKALAELEAARPGIRTDRTRFVNASMNVNWQRALQSKLIEVDLSNNRERDVHPVGFIMSNLLAGADNKTLYFIGAPANDIANPQVYQLNSGDKNPKAISNDKTFKDGLRWSSDGKYIVYGNTGNNSLPTPPGSALPAMGLTGNFGVINTQTLENFSLNGNLTALASASNKALSITREGNKSIFWLSDLNNKESKKVYETEEVIGLPTLNASGSKISFDMRIIDDYEIAMLDVSSGEVKRITREIQHDRLPQFVGENQILYVKGEPRHRRSYVYDINTGQDIKIFHNNTVRTIAPEYQWVVHPKAKGVLIQSERDGNTITPERGIYYLDLGKNLSKKELLDRLQANLAEENRLKEVGERLYGPIKAKVQEMVSQISESRIYDYAKTLYSFDSKFLTREGNLKAAEYLHAKFTEFGYEPEYQWFIPQGLRGFKDGQTANVVATKLGTTNPELIYILCSHYDSVDRGPGADDNTSGTTALLEAARVLRNVDLPFTIMFVSVTGEEAGLLGSREFVRRAVESGLQVRGVLNNDMLGWMNDQRLDNTIRYSNPGIKDIQHAAASMFTRLITYDAVYYKSTDAHAFYDAYGDVIGGIGSYPVLGNPHYHQTTDRLETISHQLVAEVSKTTAATLMLLASSPSRIEGFRAKKGNANSWTLNWSKSPESDIREYWLSYTDNSGKLVKMSTKDTTINLSNVKSGSQFMLKAVSNSGMEGWDWAYAVAE